MRAVNPVLVENYGTKDVSFSICEKKTNINSWRRVAWSWVVVGH